MVNRVLEDMLRMKVMHQPKQWNKYIPLVKFSYNNGYQESLKIIQFKVLYTRKCRVPISWDSLVDKITPGPEMLKKMEHVMARTRHNLKISQDRQNSYENIKRTHKEFKVGDHMYLRGKPQYEFPKDGDMC
jgi:hypothetical protein